MLACRAWRILTPNAHTPTRPSTSWPLSARPYTVVSGTIRKPAARAAVQLDALCLLAVTRGHAGLHHARAAVRAVCRHHRRRHAARRDGRQPDVAFEIARGAISR